MKKINILKFAFCFASISLPFLSSAQDMGHFEGNYYADYIGERVSISEPSTLARNLAYTISNDGGGSSNEWGGAVTTPMLNVEVVKADPYQACGPINAAVSGKIALVLRSDCEFGTKAKNAQIAGAIAIVIVNHSPGGPVGMGKGADGDAVNIPVLMISKEDGDAIAAALGNNETVKMSITKWGNNFTHDLGIVKSGVSMWHDYSIPGYQLENGASDNYYKGINGAVIANYGSSDETNVKLRTTLTFTPTGGTSTELRKDSVIRATFPVGDSIISPFVDEYYTLMSSRTPGRYDLKYEVSADNADEFPFDNTETYSFYVDNRILSKGRYDFANFKPIFNIGYAFTDGSAFMWGPMYHIAKGGYNVEAVQFAVSQNNVTDISGLGSMNIIIWKWVDGTNGQPTDNLLQSGEISPVGIATKKFVQGDTSGQLFTVPVTDAVDQNRMFTTEDNTNYWATAIVPGGAFLQCDGQLNYQVRSFFKYKSSQSMYEYYAPMVQGGNDAFTSSPNNQAQMFPFEARLQPDSARFAEQRKGLVPAIPFIMGLFPASVNDQVANKIKFDLNVYPNPVKDNLHFEVSLDKPAELFNFTIVSTDGRVVRSDNYHNISKQEFNVSVQSLPTGQYYIIANADDRSTTRAFTIVR